MKPFLPSQETLSSISGKPLCLPKTHSFLFINLGIPSCLLSPLLLCLSRTLFLLKKPSIPVLDKPYPTVNFVLLPYSLFLFKKLCPFPQETLLFFSRNSALLLKQPYPSHQETLPFSSRNTTFSSRNSTILLKKPSPSARNLIISSYSIQLFKKFLKNFSQHFLVVQKPPI